MDAAQRGGPPPVEPRGRLKPLRALAVAAALSAVTACGSRDELAPALNTTPPAALPTRFYPPEGWTWGLLQVGEQPPVRYGVGAPRRAHRGEIVIVPGFGEPAEAWLETANDLIASEWGVWVLDLHGQGGSARGGEPRDMVSVDSFRPDAEALRALIQDVIRPGDRPVVVLGSGEGAAVTLLSLQQDSRGVSSLVLSQPVLQRPDEQDSERARWMRRLGFGDGFADGQTGWSSRTAPISGGDPLRSQNATEWMRANPELRTGGASWSWVAAWSDLAPRAREPQRLRGVPVPAQVITTGHRPDARQTCNALPRCTLLQLDGGHAAPHLETDAVRRRWLAAVLAFAEARR